MGNVTIGRYDTGDQIIGDGQARPLTDAWAGWIEGGDTARDHRWICYLDGTGTPAVYFPDRDPDGAAVGDPIILSRP